jgi:EAL domain-containing protein (putative c-di-GMP-specific phosphodiesterase class I)
MLHRVLREEDLQQVVFEITEDGIFSDIDRARSQLLRAQDAGIKVLLDDFGVGFSSLSIATQLPIDGFKIDRGFVASLAGNPSAFAAVEAIIQLADRMDLHVIAEGVETQEQLAVLRELGVGFAQGYLFSPAVPMHAFGEWIRTGFHFNVTTPALRSADA